MQIETEIVANEFVTISEITTKAMTPKESTELLLRAVPELTPLYEKEVIKWRPDLPPLDIVYSSIFAKFIRNLFEEGEFYADENIVLKNAFDFVEKLALRPEFELQCLVEVSILESLLGQTRNDWKNFSPLFGPKTMELASDLADRMGIRKE